MGIERGLNLLSSHLFPVLTRIFVDRTTFSKHQLWVAVGQKFVNFDYLTKKTSNDEQVYLKKKLEIFESTTVILLSLCLTFCAFQIDRYPRGIVIRMWSCP